MTKKISAIEHYIRLTLVEKVKEKTGYTEVESLFGWEIAHRSDVRHRHKIEQLIIDAIPFVMSGIIALATFFLLVPTAAIARYLLEGTEFLLPLVLGWEVVVYADLALRPRETYSESDTGSAASGEIAA